MGWKGVGVDEAFGARVTKANGNVGWIFADAAVPHPASPALSMIEAMRLARKITCIVFFICYGNDVMVAVGVIVAVGAVVNVETGVTVTKVVGVSVGGCVNVGAAVKVGVAVFVDVGSSGMMVTPGTGVRVGTFGTQSL